MTGTRAQVSRKIPKQRSAMVLIMVLVVVAFLALGSYAFSDLMLAHQESAELSIRQTQTRALVDSGLDSVKLFLFSTPDIRLEQGGIYDNPTLFKGRTVIDDPDPNFRGSFAVVAPSLDSSGNYGGLRYGLEDESTRLNLNTLLALEAQSEGSGKNLLMALPGMTEDVADAILDWIDEDDEARDLGAEIDYYSGLSPAYACKNGPLETVEELLLVRGVTPALLFGADVNRNGTIDPHEAEGESANSSQGVADDGSYSGSGWASYLTLYSMESNLSADGSPRIYLNNDDLNTLYTSLSEKFPAEWATFIVAYRQNGPYTGSQEATSGAQGTLDMTRPARFPLSQLLDLVGAKTRVRFSGEISSVVLNSPIPAEIGAMNIFLPQLMDGATINPATTIPGRINVNQASATILRGIPGMDEDIVNQIITRRSADPGTDQPGRQYETWLLAEGVVTLDEMKLLQPFICGGGQVFRAQVVGYFQGGSAASRAEAIFDATTAAPRLVFWRDISHLGRGFALETLGVDYTEQ
ncbi:hypothetical protein Psta_3667 [Pirellula staleyi DSM 6068]|uniref:T2SS protein K first SAM-like domain-containing protein n=1 Tax=Pirellula staleyi (strain ATCC 27377 / DSM 6068 / ICPB 4128) TaxID=530564 RepID=D2QZD4_PIRSD|nr:type II secretion system protein GspK [Pirellula staleyi]ADB18326.1 hypothetical protein Psta_3667 [Pirellula staleyi DSM 6068]